MIFVVSVPLLAALRAHNCVELMELDDQLCRFVKGKGIDIFANHEAKTF